MRWNHHILAYFFAAAMCISTWAPAHADADSEMVVKAAMIRKFVEFIRWPDAVAPQKDRHVKVCVYGDMPTAHMEAVFAKKTANASVEYSLSKLAQLSDASSCHILFIGDPVGTALANVRNKPILTVGDSDGFAEKGGMIGFQIIDGKVRYNINNKAFGDAALKVDAQLLEIANKVVD